MKASSWRFGSATWRLAQTLAVLTMILARAVPAEAEDVADEAVHIGVLAYQGEAAALARWQPLAAWLEAVIPEHRFRIVPLSHEEFRTRIRKGQIEFALTNPAHHVGLEVEFGASRIATMRNRFRQYALTRFGAVIFTRADSGIARLEDLRGKRFAAVNPEAFGGFLLARKRLRDAGLDPLEKMQPVWLGFPQREIVLAVLAGRADAGTVRTGIIEGMIEKGEIDSTRIRILGQRTEPGFPLLLSTALYPEWPMARLPHTDEELARKVAVRLLDMDPESEVARQTRTAGWTVPLDYSPVHALLRELGMPPYQAKRRTLGETLREEWPLVVLALGLLAFSLGVIAWIVRMNRALKRSHEVIARQRDRLEERVEERTRALLDTNTELRRDIEARHRQEEILHGFRSCLAGLQEILGRGEEPPQGKLEALVLHLVECFSARRIVLIDGEMENAHGDLLYPLGHPREPAGLVDPGLAREVLTGGEPLLRQDILHGGERLCLVPFTDEAGREGVVEMILPARAEGETALLTDEIGLRLLQHLVQWIAHMRGASRRARQLEAARARLSPLTPREREVLIELARGAPNKIIARQLGISVKTVELHRSNILHKLGLSSSIEAAALAIEAGLVQASVPAGTAN